MSEELRPFTFRPLGKVKGYVGSFNVDMTGHAFPDIEVYKNKNIRQGKRLLTAIYSDDVEEIYGSSIARTTLYYGAKAYIHCPTIYVYRKDASNVTLRAYLFANNRKILKGKGKFKYNMKTVSKRKLKVVDGVISEKLAQTVTKDSTYTLAYEGYIPTSQIGNSIIYNTDIISEAQATGDIILVDDPTGEPLVVDVTNIVTNVGETTKLIARVYHQNQTYRFIIPGQYPEEGSIKFYVDNEYVGMSNITTSGFASIPYKATKKGIFDITATYIPTDNIRPRYSEMSGGGVLFVGDDTNKPVLTELVDNVGERDTTCELPFTSDRDLCGGIQLYLDNELVKLIDTESPEYKLIVPISSNKKREFTFKFFIRDGANPYDPDGTSWSFNGFHNMIIKYTTCTKDDDEQPMEYYYYWEDFYILIKTSVRLNIEEYVTPVRILYRKEDGTIEAMSDETAPKEYQRKVKQDYIIASDDIPFIVEDVDSPYDPVTQGVVKARIKSIPNDDIK